MSVPYTFTPGELISAAQMNANFDAFTGPTGSADIGFTQAGTGAVTRTAQAKMRDVVSVKDFGAVGDGVTDDTAAIQAAIAVTGTRNALWFPAGLYKVTQKITFDCAGNDVAIQGDGAGATTLAYAGSNTSDHCFQFGDGINQRGGWYISGIRFTSTTTMTSGAGVYSRGINRATWEDVVFSDQDGNSNFYIGAWFDGVDMVTVNNFRARGSAEGIRVNGVTGVGLADLFLNGGKISNSAIGLHVAGNFGGLYVDATDIIKNQTNVKISKDIVATSNREIFFGPGALIDSASTTLNSSLDGVNVDITDTGGFIFFTGTWNASCGTAIRVGASFAGSLNLNGGIVFNCFDTFGGSGDGIQVLGNSGYIRVNNTLFTNINSVAISAPSGNSSVTAIYPTFRSDVVTPFSNIKNIIARDARIPSGVDNSPAQTTTGSNLSLVSYQTTGVSWISTSLSRSGTFGSHVAASGDFGGLAFCGSDGSKFMQGATVLAYVDGTVSNNTVPSALRFRATNSAGALTNYWDIRANGTLEPFVTGVYNLGSSSKRVATLWSQNIKANGLPTYADDAAAGAGGLTQGDFYQTAAGELRVKL